MKRGLGVLLTFAVSITFFLSGCSSQPNPEQEHKTKVSKRQVCVSSSMRVSELVKKASEAFHQNYRFDGGRCDDIVIPIDSGNYCFNSLSDIDYFIQNNTDYLLEVNTKRDKGLPVYGLTVKQAIDYFNAKGSHKKIIFIDDDLKLKDNAKITIKTMADLKKYVSRTTPLYFAKLSNSENAVVYTLRYKKANKRLGDTDAIVLNLKEARKLTKEIKTMNAEDKLKIVERTNNVIKGVENYEK